jgi:hypothetical protein
MATPSQRAPHTQNLRSTVTTKICELGHHFHNSLVFSFPPFSFVSSAFTESQTQDLTLAKLVL